MIVPVELLQESGIKILTAILLVAVSGILIGYSSGLVRKVVGTRFENKTVLKLIGNVYQSLAWFTVGLLVLSLLGFSEIAAALGTAAGFVALGVSFALKNLISDTVAGVYLAKDPDFNNGDTVEVDGVTGEVTDVGLKKSRLELENGNTRVINNSDVERKWTLVEHDAS